MTELVTFGETPLRFTPPDHQRLEVASETKMDADGMSSNVAIAGNDLGADTAWLSTLPKSPLGRRVVSQIQAHGVDTHVTWSDADGDRQGLVFHETGANPRQSYDYHDRQATAFGASEPSDYPVDVVQGADVVFTDLSSAVLSENAAETTAALVRAGGGAEAVTAMDVNYAPGLADLEVYRNIFEALADDVDVLFANEDAVRSVLELSGTPRELVNLVGAEYSFDIVAITRSERGAVTLHDTPGTNVIHEREMVDATHVDTAGQHGAFVGAFLEELIRGSDAARALTYAVAAATLTRTLPGPHLRTAEGELEPLVDAIIERSS